MLNHLTMSYVNVTYKLTKCIRTKDIILLFINKPYSWQEMMK